MHGDRVNPPVHAGAGVKRKVHLAEREHRDRHRRDAALYRAVAGLVREAVGAVEIQRWCVTETAVAVEPQHAVGRTAHQHRAEAVAVAAAVIGEDARGVHSQRRVLVDTVIVVVGHRHARWFDGSIDIDGAWRQMKRHSAFLPGRGGMRILDFE